MEKKDILNEEEREQVRHSRFLRRLRIRRGLPKLPIRNWMAWVGVALFIAMVIIYYLTGGAG